MRAESARARRSFAVYGAQDDIADGHCIHDNPREGLATERSGPGPPQDDTASDSFFTFAT